MFCEISFVMSNIWCQIDNKKNPSMYFTPIEKTVANPAGVSSVICALPLYQTQHHYW